MKIKYQESSPAGTMWADILPFEDSHASVTVSRRLNLSTRKLEPAEINWPCIGSTTPTRTEQFVEALTSAVSIALAMDESPDIFRKKIAEDK